MPITSSIVEAKELVSIVASGVTSDKEWADACLSLERNPRRKENMDMFFDFRRHESIVPVEVIQSLSTRVHLKNEKIKWAFLISRSSSYEKVTALTAVLEKKSIEGKAFYDMGEAEKWLSE